MNIRLYGNVRDTETDKPIIGASLKLYLDQKEIQKCKTLKNGFYEIIVQIDDSRIKGGQQLKLTFEKAGYKMLENFVFAEEGSFNMDAALLKVEATQTKLEPAPPKKPFNWLPMIIGGGALLIILNVGIIVFLILSRPSRLPIRTIAWSDITGKPSGFSDNMDHVNDADADPNNEIQTLGKSGNSITLSMGGGSITVPYATNAATANDADKLDGKDASKFLNISPGSIIMYPATSPPSEWLICDGSEVSRTTYPDLFAVIGVTYGFGNGITTFNLPDLRQRFPLGKADTGTGSKLGGKGGAIDHTHSFSSKHFHQIPSHSHSFTTNSAGRHDHGGYTGHEDEEIKKTFNSPHELVFTDGDRDHYHSISPNGEHKHTGNTDSVSAKTGYSNISDNTLSNNPPFLVINYIIKF